MKLGPSRDLVTNMCKNIIKKKKMDGIYGIYKNSIYRQIQSSWHPLTAPPPALNSASKLRFDNSGVESLADKNLAWAFLVFGSLLKHRWVSVCRIPATTKKMWSVSYFISVRSNSGVQIEFPIDFKVIMEKVFGLAMMKMLSRPGVYISL